MSITEHSVREPIHVPPREGRGVRVAAGELVRCTDVEGGQCGDVFAFVDSDVREYHSAEHTRVHVNRLFPQIGEQFVTNRRRPIFTLVGDTSPGRHDMLIAACDPSRFAGLGVEGWHASCQENLETVMAGFGFEEIEVPSPINIFTNLPVSADGDLGWEPSVSQAGDHITFRAELDCLVVLSACPQDILPINNNDPTSLALQVVG